MPARTPGETIKELRETRGLSLREAGRRAGEALTYQQISYLEKHPGAWDNVSIGTLQTLARIYNVNLDYLTRIALGRPTNHTTPETTLEVHPDWVRLPIYGTVSAGDSEAEPDNDSFALVPREHLDRKGANLDTLRTYVINGDCMVSDNARRADKNYAHGDIIVVDYTRAPSPNDVVVAWWDEQHKMILKKYGETESGLVLYPLKSSGVPVVLNDPSDVRILGVVIWRGG